MAHPLAGQPAPASILVDVPRLVSAYYARRPDTSDPSERVAFGTSGHRGSALRGSFNEAHIVAISAAIVERRAADGITGPLFLGMDTHALSTPALYTALEVFAAAGVSVRIDAADGYTPTPAISFAILEHNRRHRGSGLADGVVVTPSHNPPEDGGFKYNPPHGGPAGGEVTRAIEERANELLRGGVERVARVSLARALAAETTARHDYVTPYVESLARIIDMDAIATAGLRIGVDPMGGAGIAYWAPMVERYRLDITVVNPRVDPTFAFMSVDKDGKIRMDCSSPHAMASLVALKDRYDIAFGNDTDYDRHGIVTPSAGLMNPNHYLAVAIDYLFRSRAGWAGKKVGKTLVSSGMIDRVAAALGAPLHEVPVGFKWFVDGLVSGELGFGGEESAGASFLRMDGSVWTTDKDGIILDLLAAEITAKTGKDPGLHYRALEQQHGAPVYERVDAPADREQRARLARLSPEQVQAETLAGEPIVSKLTRAPGNGAEIGGLKVTTQNGWFAARPSGTEDVYKIYAESFLGRAHLGAIQDEAKAIVRAALE